MRAHQAITFIAVLTAATLGAQYTAGNPADVFLDRARPEAERLAAAEQILHPDKQRSAEFLAIAADRGQSDAIRFQAFYRHQFTREWLELALKVLDDPNDGGPLLDSKLTEEMSRRLTFRLAPEVRLRIRNVWRKLLDDPRDAVRLSAFRVLATNHDPVAVNRLSESLRRRARPPIPLDEAIELLEFDGPVNHLSALRPYLNHSDPRVRAVAARALSVDPQSRPRIVGFATSANEPVDVRANALRGLARQDAKFGSYTLPIVENAEEDGDVRYAAMHAFIGRMNYSEVNAQDQIRFAQAVEKIVTGQNLRNDSTGRIRKEARELFEYLKTGFPAVRDFYAAR